MAVAVEELPPLEQEVDDREYRSYKLLFGLHIYTDEEGRELIVGPGSIIRSKKDLTEFNGRGMTPKFELIDEHGELVDENSKLRAKIAELEAQLRQGQG